MYTVLFLDQIGDRFPIHINKQPFFTRILCFGYRFHQTSQEVVLEIRNTCGAIMNRIVFLSFLCGKGTVIINGSAAFWYVLMKRVQSRSEQLPGCNCERGIRKRLSRI